MLGTQQTTYGPKYQVMFMFELLDITNTSGQPFVLRRTYTAMLDPMGALRPDLIGWIGHDLRTDEWDRFDLTSLLGTCCLIGVKHETRSDRTFANITSIMRRPEGTPDRSGSKTGQVAFSLDDEPFDSAAYAALPQWLQRTIAQSPEYKKRRQAPSEPALTAAVHQHLAGGSGYVSAPAPMRPPADDLDDTIPFITCDPASEPYLKKWG
jgi:hypothetical protein